MPFVPFFSPIGFKCGRAHADESYVVDEEDRDQKKGGYMHTPEKYGNLKLCKN